MNLVGKLSYCFFFVLLGFNMVMRKAFANSKPEIVFEVNGKTFKIQTTTTFKTMNAEFTLGTIHKLRRQKETDISERQCLIYPVFQYNMGHEPKNS